MYQIHCLNKIAAVGTNRLGANYELVDTADRADAILVRSASMHEMEFSQSLLAIARAGAPISFGPKVRLHLSLGVICTYPPIEAVG